MDIRMSNIASPMPQIRAKFTNKLGIPLSGCKVYTYEPNSDIPKTTWLNIDKTTENTNPILLDAAGEADIFLDGLYRVVVKDRFGFVVYDVEKTGTHTKWDASLVVDASGKTQQQINNTQARKNKENLTITDYSENATIDASLAILAMQSDVGFVRIPEGVFNVLTDTTIDVPITFNHGAALSAATGVIVNVKNVIDSPQQHIFRGLGTYNLGTVGIANGEASRQVHASWFGAIGGPDDATAAIQRACDAVGDIREAVIDFDISNYIVSGTIYVGRCTLIRGKGTRRTVFRTASSAVTSDIFQTKSEGVTFQGIQFETATGTPKSAGNWINVLHENCKILDVQAGHANYGIKISGDSCEVRGVKGKYGYSLTGADSYLVNVASGAAAIVDDVQILKTGFNPAHTVLVGGANQTGTVAGATIKDIKTQGVGVTIKPKSGQSVARCNVRDIFGLSTAQQNWLVLADTNGGNIVELTVDGLTATNLYDTLYKFKIDGGSFVRHIADNMTAAHNAAVPTQSMVSCEYISGTVMNLTFKSGCRATNRPIIINLGALPKNTTGLYVAPELDQLNSSACKVYSIAVNSSQKITLSRSIILSYATVAYQSSALTGFASGMLRAFTTPSATAIASDANVVFATDQTLATAAAGKITISANADGTIDIINKLVGLANISFAISC